MNEKTTEQAPLDEYEQIGLHKENVTGVTVYFLEFDDNIPTTDTLQQLKDKLKLQKVSVELGPGNQLESLLFAAKKSEAQVVIGIDPDLDTSKIKPPSIQGNETPTIILFKGDGWELGG